MKKDPIMPSFLQQAQDAFLAGRHVIFHQHTEDRVFPHEISVPCRLEYALAEFFGKHDYRIALLSPSQPLKELLWQKGSYRPIKQAPNQSDPLAKINFLAQMLQQKDENWLAIVKHPELLMPGQEQNRSLGGDALAVLEALHTLGIDDMVMRGQSRLALITYSGLPDRLIAHSRGYQILEIPLPNREQRQRFIDFLLQRLEGCSLQKNFSTSHMARLARGMLLRDLEALLRLSAHQRKPLPPATLIKAKASAIREMAGDLLEVSEPQHTLDQLAGLKNWKQFINELAELVKIGSKEIPMGIMQQGVPGVGKSFSARIMAAELGWPLIMLRNIRGPYVGQTEINLERAIAIIESQLPAVLFMDEIDQVLGQRQTGPSGDSGTNARLLARLFEWMASSHLRGKIIFLGATNRPDLLDSAAMDRFGVSVPFLRPDAEEIKEMIPLFLKRFGRSLAEDNIQQLVLKIKTMGLSGRDIQELIINAAHLADRQTGKLGSPIQIQHLESAAKDQIPREDPAELQFLELVSLSLCSRQSLLPWNGPNGLRPEAEIPKWLLEMAVVTPKGWLDKARLHEVLAQMRHQRAQKKRML